MSIEVIQSPMPKMPKRVEPPKHPVKPVALTEATGAADYQGVIVVLSPAVQWMRKNGII
jgi:hypothetical protein